jgi:hypothetical protein
MAQWYCRLSENSAEVFEIGRTDFQDWTDVFFLIVKPTRRTSFSNLFYFVVALYVFRTVFLSIIRSLRLCIQHRAYVKQILLTAS